MLIILRKKNRPSPAECRQMIANQNDGTMPQEPYQRIMQSIFEKVLRKRCSDSPSITMLYGTFNALQEFGDEVLSTLALAGTRRNAIVHSKYVVGCDGAKSRVRKIIGVDIHGEELPVKFFLVHFRSRDLNRMHCQGPFWHVFYTNGGILISQDEIDTWTVHLPFPLDVDTSSVDSLNVIFTVLGGSLGPYKISVDEILVSGFWRPGTFAADAYRSQEGRVFLAGDSVHQCIPTGAYGMNTGVADGYDISWKMAAVLNGFGGEQLLRSYELERRPVGLRNVAQSLDLMQVHLTYVEWVQKASKQCLASTHSKESRLLCEKIRSYVTINNTEICEEGIELDYRHPDSPVVVPDLTSTVQEPAWEILHYTPSTLPGHRAPHVILSDGMTSTYDLCGPWYSIFDFSADGSAAKVFSDTACQLNIPLKPIHLPSELHVKSVWKSEAVLVRPDYYVAWRSSRTVELTNPNTAKAALLVAIGR